MIDMDTDPDEDVCRICAAPGDASQPLFHPCKCSGTIRYIHQECLATWLAHSKKTTCDVCKHKFAFTKVYDSKMPQRLPIILFLRRFSVQLSTAGLLALRGALVGIVWLAMLPYSTVWTWRFFFWSGDALSWFIAGRLPPMTNHTSTIVANVTEGLNSTSTVLPENRLHPLLRTLSSDIFTGQIITSVIVLLFLSLFLLREWIFQNAPADNLALGEGEALDEADQDAAMAIAPVMAAAAAAEAIHPAEVPGNIPEQPVAEILEEEAEIAEVASEVVPEDLIEHEADDGIPPATSLMSDEREAEPAEYRTYFPPEKALYYEDGSDRASHQAVIDSDSDEPTWEDMPSLLHMSASQPTVSDASFDHDDMVPSASPAPEVTSLPSHSPETSDWQVVEDDSVNSSILKHQVSGSSSNSLPEARAPTWSNPRPERGPVVKRRRTITLADMGPSLSGAATLKHPTPGDGSDDLPDEIMARAPQRSASTGWDTSIRGVKRTREDGDESGDEFAVREPPNSLPMLQSHVDALRERRKSYVRRSRLAAKRPPTPWRSPEALPNSSDSDDEHETDSGDLSNAQTNPFTLPAQEKGKERAPPPPRITIQTPMTPTLSSSIPLLNPSSPNRISPRRPGLPPSLPTPIHRSVHRQSDDATPLASTSASNIRGVDSPGGAYYRAPEDMDYFGDAEETDLSANEAPPEGSHPGRPSEHDRLNSPGRDLTVNVANPLEEDVLPPPAPAPALPPVQPRMVDDEPQPLMVINNDVAEIAAGEGDARDGDDDMDGALEAVGMRGPIHQLFQNVALMMCILDVFIGAAVFLPFIIGKSAALLSLDHRRALLIINLPIKLIRIFTDPVVDVIAVITRTLLFGLARLLAPSPLRAITLGVWKVCLRAAATVFPRRAPVTPATHVLKNIVWPRVNATIQSYSASAMSYFDSAFDAHPSAEESFATIGAFLRHIKPHLKDLRKTYSQQFRLFVEKDTAFSRAFTISLGYSLIAIGLGIWMQSVKQERIKGFAKSLRNSLHQQLLVTKVAFFIVIELVLFPLGCGIVLDLCAMPLFPEATIVKRVAFAVYAPVTCTFIHWTLGTMFMFQFAMLLDGCRKIMRPGALWFLKDPQDPQYSPIQDILSRPAASQLRKLFTSALMYCFVVFVGIGSVIWFMRHFRPFQGLLPFRWKIHQPLSEVPIDLLFVHIVVPATVKKLRLRRYVKDIATRLWKALSIRLRLTSYMFGGRHPEEEHPQHFGFLLGHGEGAVALEPDGGLFRVPANDQIMLVPRVRVVIPLDANGHPIDEAARERMDRQDEEARRHGRNPQDDYTVVFLPPHFGRRVMIFSFLIWMFGMAGLVAFISAPLITGRVLLDGLLDREVHDVYAFGVGFHILTVGFYFGRSIYRVVARRPNMSAFPVLAGRAIKGSLWLIKMTWLMFAFYIVLPILAGIALELHVILPVKFVVHPLRTPVFHVVENWASGVVLCQIAARLLRLRRAPIMEAIDEARANSWANPQAWTLTKNVIFPLIITGFGANILPAYLARSLIRLGFCSDHPIVLYRMIYPFWVMTLCQTLLLIRVFELIGLWVQTVRDKEFLVELRLRNLDN